MKFIYSFIGSQKLFAIVALLMAASMGSAQMPAVDLKNLEGKTINTAAITENNNKPIVVNFWATWCAPCKRELNTIAEVYEQWQEETGVVIYAISIDDARQMHKVAPYVNGSAWDFEVLLDPNGDFKRALNVNNVPHTFVFNGKGELVYQHNNYAPGDEEELYHQIKKAANL